MLYGQSILNTAVYSHYVLTRQKGGKRALWVRVMSALTHPQGLHLHELITSKGPTFQPHHAGLGTGMHLFSSRHGSYGSESGLSGLLQPESPKAAA